MAETSSASAGSTSGASVTSASRRFLIDFESSARAVFAHRRSVATKTRLRMGLVNDLKIAVGCITYASDDICSLV